MHSTAPVLSIGGMLAEGRGTVNRGISFQAVARSRREWGRLRGGRLGPMEAVVVLGAFGPGRSGAAVFDLPGVVEDVPGNPAGGVAGRPALRPERRTVRGRAQHGDDLAPQDGDCWRVVARWLTMLEAELA